LITTDAQVRKLMEELTRHGSMEKAALRSGMDPKTARKYEGEGKLPSELKQQRDWRTRPDPFEEDWEEIRTRLMDAPELEAKALFEDLMERKPGRYEPGQVRTLQRRIRRWRGQEGPERRVFFAQEHRPGEAMQTDFTSGNALGVTIAGEAFRHLLCHPVLPYSNWEWATVCRSESMAALRRGVQAAVFRLGRVPEFHQTDNSTAATHDLSTGKRGFNSEYEALMRHLGMKPRTTQVGEKEQNGDVEALNGALKRRMEQQLLLRGSREFGSVREYEGWLEGIVAKANRSRQTKVGEELDVMKPLRCERLPEWSSEEVTVTEWGTIRVKKNTYSVPSRLVGRCVQVRVFDDRLEVYYGGALQLEVERLLGRGGKRINYRHIIWSLVRQPGAFERYRYREELFPTLAFRKTYDALQKEAPGFKGDLEYLRVLHLSAATMESQVAEALEALLSEGLVPLYEAVRSRVTPGKPEIPDVKAPEVDLHAYDDLLTDREGSL
jgi:transposase